MASILLLVFLNNCDLVDIRDVDADNSPPGNFNLLNIPEGTYLLELDNVIFTWEAAIDPDGDDIIYEVYFGTDPLKIDKLVTAVYNDTSFVFNGRFESCTNYFWEVIAKDGRGGETRCNRDFRFETRLITYEEEPITESANFGVRNSHASAIYDHRLWVVGGSTKEPVTNNDIYYNDVWYSYDGMEWEEISANAPFSARDAHTSVIFDDKLWVIAGNDGNTRNDVWSTEDGQNWVEAVHNAPFPSRMEHTSAVLDGKMWVIGGRDGNFNDMNDVWFSIDGTNWTKTTGRANFSPRSGHSTVVYDDKIWLIGGYGDGDFKNDVWYSSDGTIWTEATSSLKFPARSDHSTVVLDRTIFIVGGRIRYPLGEQKDMWYSKDGAVWREVTNNAPFGKRANHTSINLKDKIYTIAGARSVFDGNRLNDVWMME